MRCLGSLSLLLALSFFAPTESSGQSSSGQAPTAANPQPDLALPSSVYVKVQLEKSVKVSALKTGDVIDGKLAQDVYSGDRELFPAGSQVNLTVDKLGRRRRVPNDHWPWVIKAFTPRHENYPTFQSATVSLPDGKEIPLRVSLVFINRETEVRAQAKAKVKSAVPPTGGDATQNPSPAQTKPQHAGSKRASPGPVVTLQAVTPTTIFAAPGSPADSSSAAALAGPMTLSAGTRAKIILLGRVSASESRAGDFFQARLVEPVRLNSIVVLPEGTLFGGKVVARTPPRMLSRAGSLLLSFTGLTLPGGVAIPASASVASAELDTSSHTKIDPEGKLHGDRPGKAWMLVNVGATAGIAKVADDGTQLLLEAIVETATDASTAGTAKIVAACASGMFMLTRHGRDVVLPQFTEMEVTFDRPVSLTGQQAASHIP